MIYQRLFKGMFSALLLMLSFNFSANAQESEVKELLTQKDKIFWKAYNECDIAGMDQFLAKDIEFYHDKGGITMGSDDLNEGMRKGLCSGGKNAVRREAVPGTVQVYPLFNNGELYGAIMTGEHLFYSVKGDSEKLEGRANFSHLWLKKDGEWRMHRVFSYDHRPAGYENPKDPVDLNKEQLQEFSGRYLTLSGDTILVQVIKNHLELEAMGNTFVLFPQNEHSFFTKERDLSFNFSNDDPVQLEILEGENKVAEAVFQKK